MNRVKIITFYGVDADPKMLKAQAKVMDKLNIAHQQILTELSHADAMDCYLKLHKAEIYIFFDLDCIPLCREIIDLTILKALEGKIVGCAQNANHINNSPDYASSFFIGFSETTYKRMGRPSFAATDRGDVAAELSYSVSGERLYLLPPISVEFPKWKLANGKEFGYGTNYADCIYHGFESRFQSESTKMFLNKCLEVLND